MRAMTNRKRLLTVLATVLVAMSAATPAMGDAGLEPVFSSDLLINGVTISADGRMFLPVQPKQAGDGGAQVVEIRNGTPEPYPDARWNGWTAGMDGADSFVGVNAIRVGPDGALWVVDHGSPRLGQPLVAHGVKIVRIDLATDLATRVYDLGPVTQPWSFVDDIRFNGPRAYLTDAGHPGLIVLDLTSGRGRRVLDGHPSTIAQTPLKAERKPLRDPEGNPINIHADQLEVSPDGRWFYYQPTSGGLSRIPTRYLDDAAVTAADLAANVELFAATPSTGGTAMDANGTIYLSDMSRSRILTISSDGNIDTLIADPRLIWVDAMWIDDNGNLLMPASQLNRRIMGASTLSIFLYSLPIGARGVPT